MYTGVEPNLKSPYSGYISASKKVMPDEIIEDFSSLFITLIEDGNLISSYLKAATEDTNFFYKDSKTTFEENMQQTKFRIYNDPNYRKEQEIWMICFMLVESQFLKIKKNTMN